MEEKLERAKKGIPHMDWKRFDLLRRDAGAVELDLVESYAQKKINRRDFVRRGAIVGLSAPFMGAVIAACGDDDDDEAGSDTTAGGSGSGGGTVGGNLICANQFGDANSGLDPVNMLDLGTYNVCSQSFEYLVGLGPDGNIAPPGASTGLAVNWFPNDDGSQWTFELREGVTWQDGSEFTSADVAATMDRLAAAGNAGLGGVIGEGSTDASDPLTAVITLIEPNGNLPVLVSIFNAQALIAPADYSSGTTLDERPEGTGPWILESFDPTTFVANFRRNDNWWGGQTLLDTIELRGFADIGTAVTAMQSREVDAIQNFSVIGGEGLLGDDSFTVLTPPAANHRQVWFNVAQGKFDSNLVRQALGWTFDRDQMVNTLFAGRAEIGNDHPILSTLPFFDPDATPQRTRDIERARQLIADSGATDLTGTIECGDLGEVPDLAAIIQQNAAEAGFELQVNVQSNSTFYGDSWCPGPSETDPNLPCDGSSDLGIVDYGHRPIPDIFLSSALSSGGVWNSSNYANPEFDDQLSAYRRAVDVDGQKAAIGRIQQILHEDGPALYPYFFNWLAGHADNVSGVETTSLGHMIFSKASKS
jgi:peptide/nickel transport system substrate-binding protein